MPFDVNSALQSGYTKQEIATFLADKHGFDLNGALQNGYTVDDAINTLSPLEGTPAQAKSPSVFGYIAHAAQKGIEALGEAIGSDAIKQAGEEGAAVVDQHPSLTGMINNELKADAGQYADIPSQFMKGVTWGYSDETTPTPADAGMGRKIAGGAAHLAGMAVGLAPVTKALQAIGAIPKAAGIIGSALRGAEIGGIYGGGRATEGDETRTGNALQDAAMFATFEGTGGAITSAIAKMSPAVKTVFEKIAANEPLTTSEKAIASGFDYVKSASLGGGAGATEPAEDWKQRVQNIIVGAGTFAGAHGVSHTVNSARELLRQRRENSQVAPETDTDVVEIPDTAIGKDSTSADDAIKSVAAEVFNSERITPVVRPEAEPFKAITPVDRVREVEAALKVAKGSGSEAQAETANVQGFKETTPAGRAREIDQAIKDEQDASAKVQTDKIHQDYIDSLKARSETLALPEGQGFTLVPEQPRSVSPELAAEIQRIRNAPLALPPGQGFELASEKPKSILRKVESEPDYQTAKTPDNVTVEYAPILSRSGGPYKYESSARAALQTRQIPDADGNLIPIKETHEVVPVGEGYGLKRKAPAAEIIKPEDINQKPVNEDAPATPEAIQAKTVADLQAKIADQESYIARNESYKGTPMYKALADALSQDKSKLAELTGEKTDTAPPVDILDSNGNVVFSDAGEVPKAAEIVQPERASQAEQASPVVAKDNQSSTGENIITALERQGGVNWGPSYNYKEMRQFPDGKRISNKTGMAPDAAAEYLNDNGYVHPDGQPFTADTLAEIVKTGQGRNILTPDKADSIMSRQIKREENAYIEDQLAKLRDEEGIDAGSIEESSAGVKSGLLEKARAQGLVDEEAAHRELDDFFSEVSKEKPPVKFKEESGELPGLGMKENFNLVAEGEHGGELKPENVLTKTEELFGQEQMAADTFTGQKRTPQQQAIVDTVDSLRTTEKRKGYTPREVIEAAEKATGETSPYRFLLTSLEKLGVKVSFNADKIKARSSSAAVYDPNTNEIIFNDITLKYALDPIAKFNEVMSHEGIHAIVVNLKKTNMNAYFELRAKLGGFVKDLTPHLDTADGFTRSIFKQINEKNAIDEIVNMAFTNPNFAKWLDGIKANEGVKESPTLWGKLKAVILKAVERVTKTSQTKLDELNGIMDSYLFDVDSGKGIVSNKQEPMSKNAKAKEGTATLRDTVLVRELNAAFSKQEGEGVNAYEPASGMLPGIREAFQKTFGVEVVPILPTSERFNDFLGMQHKGRLFVNVGQERHGFVQLAGHELLHKIRIDEPALYSWFENQAIGYLKPDSTERYRSMLEKVGGDKANPREELIADFVGDALADKKFLSLLKESSPGRFRQFTGKVISWLDDVKNKLFKHGFGSSQYFDETAKLRDDLAAVLDIYAEAKDARGKQQETMSKEPGKAEDAEKYSQRAIKKYGIASADESIGYITRSGKAIDSSGRKQGSSSQGRNIDHRQIAKDALGDDATDGWSQNMRLFMNATGNIRVVGAKGEVNIDIPINNGMPSQAQLNVIKRLSAEKKIYYDFTDPEGNNVASGEGSYGKFTTDLRQTIKNESETKTAIASGNIPKQLQPMADFIKENNLTKEEFKDIRYNDKNPLHETMNKLMDKASLGINKVGDDFGFSHLGEFYDRVMQDAPGKDDITPKTNPEPGGNPFRDSVFQVPNPSRPREVGGEEQLPLPVVGQMIATAKDKIDRTIGKVEKVKAAQEGFSASYEGLKRAFYPSALSEDATKTAETMIEQMGKNWHQQARLKGKLNEVVKQYSESTTVTAKGLDLMQNSTGILADGLFNKMPKEKQWDFISRIQSGQKQETPELQGIADTLSKMFDDLYKDAESVTPGTVKYRQGYFPGMWEDEAAAKKFFSERAKSMEGSKAFIKEKVFDNIQEGIDAGLKPKGTPIDMAFAKMNEVQKYVTTHRTLQEMVPDGTAILVRSGQEAPEGYQLVPGPYGIVTKRIEAKPGSNTEGGGEEFKEVSYRYAAKDDVAQVISNYLSRSLYDSPYVGQAWKAYMGAANTLNQFQLGVGSAFHAGFTSMEAVISKFSLGVKAAARGDVGEALKLMAESPLQVYKNPMLGDKLLRAYRGESVTGEEIPRIVQWLEMAGARAHMDNRLRTASTDKLMVDWQEGNKLSVVARSPFAMIEQLARPIMEWLVPRQKFGVFAEMATDWNKQNPNASHDETRTAMQYIWNRVDSRLGQVVYERLFTRNVAKNIVQGLIRAPGWSGGTIVEIGGGVNDFANVFKDMVNGKKPVMTDKMAYTISLLVVTGLINGVMTKLLTGENPKDGMDLLAFRTGRTDEQGNPERMLLPTYAKDIYAYINKPGQTLLNKTHPIISLMADIAKNKDYYGVQVRNPESNLAMQGVQTGEFALKAFVPFWMRGFQKAQGRGDPMTTKLSPFIGIMPATAEFSTTKAQLLMSEILGARPKGTQTREEFDRNQLKRRFETRIRNNDAEASEDMRQAVDEGALSFHDLHLIRKAVQTPYEVGAFKRLTVDEALRVYAEGTQEEQSVFAPLLRKKMLTTKNLPAPQGEEIRKQYRRVMGTE